MALEALKCNGHNLELGLFPLDGPLGIPRLVPAHLNDRIPWIPFNCVMSDRQREAHGVHFFIDDYLFQRAWNDPCRYANLLSGYQAVMTPDFSMFTDYPVAVQLYNHWRKHHLGAYWQSLGLTVIPSICWSGHDSYAWCFDGELVGGTVAVSSVGTQKSTSEARFSAIAGSLLRGYAENPENLPVGNCDADIAVLKALEKPDPYYGMGKERFEAQLARRDALRRNLGIPDDQVL